MTASLPEELVDAFGRQIRYLRLSVTDRCDFRCVYCMAEEMTFLPRREVLSLEELEQVAAAFVDLGVRKLRLTGGEPLVRRGIVDLARRLGRLPGLEELVLTTNGSRLAAMAAPLRDAGVRRLNISIDSLRPERFRALTRTGDLARVLEGIEAARAAGFERIRLNSVILRGRNDDEVVELVSFARERGLDIAFIEEMPLGAIEEHNRREAFISSADLQERIASHFALEPLGDPAGAAGPARRFRIAGTDSAVGFISPHSNNFCHLCNRVRVTVEGRLLLCLGNEHALDLRELLRRPQGDPFALHRAIADAMARKPERHHFSHGDEPEIVRFMNATGG
ncbi:GTP 3',8-cyclase MoaA [Pseudohaliea rubra]|uniref:GTP 3',8-cyclase n=1 Tax=Pseudohaliea rubra DSM 19751 TaxID=1265313 RepID=A0A095VSI2_9GAMM|nr:GTP 3',8-cyclase MoaA [Pseudohaliea rubra]KGE04038.1 Molybdenum cofactor biosynthesis protein MoaA [Pseudohaliea rubra DSM 19751]